MKRSSLAQSAILPPIEGLTGRGVGLGVGRGVGRGEGLGVGLGEGGGVGGGAEEVVPLGGLILPVVDSSA